MIKQRNLTSIDSQQLSRKEKEGKGSGPLGKLEEIRSILRTTTLSAARLIFANSPTPPKNKLSIGSSAMTVKSGFILNALGFR